MTGGEVQDNTIPAGDHRYLERPATCERWKGHYAKGKKGKAVGKKKEARTCRCSRVGCVTEILPPGGRIQSSGGWSAFMTREGGKNNDGK